jgi:tryptophanyl-tRNA synthetase
MRKRVFSGARPTARQHIGNLLGAINNYVKLQQEYDCIYCIVDIHALTTLQETDKIQGYISDLALDWLASGIDPQKSILFVQSHVPNRIAYIFKHGDATQLVIESTYV